MKVTVPTYMAQELRNRYPDFRKFLTTYDCTLQERVVMYQENAYFGTSPTLAALAVVYGKLADVNFVRLHLANVVEKISSRAKMTDEQLQSCAMLICGTYGWLKCSEFILFCALVQCGNFGTFEWRIDSPSVMNALGTFVRRDRAEAIAKYESYKHY